LEPLTLARVAASREDRAALARDLQADLPDDWPSPDVFDYLPIFAEYVREEPLTAEWHRLMVLREPRRLIGSLGFLHRPRRQGLVRLSYEVVAAERRRGYAGEALTALLDWAFESPALETVQAVCDLDNLPSQGLLEKLRFRPGVPRGSVSIWDLSRVRWQRWQSQRSAACEKESRDAQ